MDQNYQPTEHIENSNHSDNPHFNEILNARIDRRSVLRGGLGMTAAMMLGGAGLVGCSDNDDDNKTTAPPTTDPTLPLPEKLNFTPVAHSTKDVVVVPEEYQVQGFLPVGTPIAKGLADWDDSKDHAGESYEFRMGDNHDGLWFFGMDQNRTKHDANASERGLLATNHEYVEHARLHTRGFFTTDNPNVATDGQIFAKVRLADDVRREINAHGVSIVELERQADKQLKLVLESKFNRRITSSTLADIAGPAAGHDLLKTKMDPTGKTTRGINNQCGSNRSPWGTYLTVEENFLNVFARGDDSAQVSVNTDNALKRYGLGLTTYTKAVLDENGVVKKDADGKDILEINGKGALGGGFLWHTAPIKDEQFPGEFSRWNSAITGNSATEDYRNYFNTFGYVTEIDPFSPNSRPVKRTALGRFNHENCGYAPVKSGEPVVFYMGDDARGEYIYKFVSKTVWDPKDATGGLKSGDKYMNEGTLYVAKFNADSTGEWLELTYGKNGLTNTNSKYPFASQADILIFTRLAADVVGATKMDRPEWVTTSPITGEVYVTLTNNSHRDQEGRYPADAANPRNYDGTGDGKADGNHNGHIIRWREDGDKHTATQFVWDIYLFGSPTVNQVANLSGLNAENDFSCPDGLLFDDRGLLWIQTDDHVFRQTSNCMMLVALPGEVGDGKTVVTGNGVTTHVGANPTTQNLARFLVGPLECEITGVAYTPDMKTMLVSVQHPGENGNRTDGYNSHWPDSQTNPSSKALPRSALAMITRKDGGVIVG